MMGLCLLWTSLASRVSLVTTAGGTEIMYVAPEIVEVGSIRELTLGGKDAQEVDATFATNAATGKLTFS
jgi:hypothetical protein